MKNDQENIFQNIHDNYLELKRELAEAGLSKERLLSIASRIRFYEFIGNTLDRLVNMLDPDDLEFLKGLGTKIIDHIWDFAQTFDDYVGLPLTDLWNMLVSFIRSKGG